MISTTESCYQRIFSLMLFTPTVNEITFRMSDMGEF